MKLSHKTVIFWAGLIFLATVVAYIPAMRGGYIWDDDRYITENVTLRTLDGLRRIWLEPKALPQYYPLVHTSFWLEYHLWQLHPFGYHLVNVVLHAFNVILLLLVLRYLRVPGAWLAAALFALHPVHVESVAWITERKNVLSGFFYLASALAYFRFANVTGDLADTTASSDTHLLTSDKSPRSWGYYVLSLFLFLCALLSKTVTSSLPAAILLVLWWKRGRICRSDILTLIPYFVVGALFGLTTVWLEKYHVGAQGEEWALSFLDRLLVAGRALWFYAGKLVWPYELTFIYPRWQIDAGVWWQYLFPVAAMAVIFTLWLLRQRLGKGPLVAVLFFAGTLFPALGFFDVYPMRFSFVADHFQYLASIGLISLFSASISIFCIRLGSSYRNLGFVACFGALLALGLGVWKQGSIYRDAEMVYRDTIAKNPNAWMAHNNLGFLLVEDGSLAAAMTHYTRALRIKPDSALTHYNMAKVLYLQEKFDEAIAHYYKALEIKPNHAGAHNNLGVLLAKQGKLKEARRHYSEALRLNPDSAETHNNLALTLVKLGEIEAATEQYQKALEIKPHDAGIHNNFGTFLAQQGKLDQAIAHFSRALELKPDFAEVYGKLGNVFKQQGKMDKAIANYSRALEIKPNHAEAHNNLGVLLAKQGKLKEARRHYSEALRLNPDSAETHNNLALTLVKLGEIETAIPHYAKALDLQPDYAEAHNNLGNALAREGKLDEAIVHYARALEIQADYPEAHNNLGVALAQQGKLNESIAHFNEALRLKPDYVPARANLDRALQMITGGR
jgi:tetratricopeptide (TPR) repeat protein